MYEALMHRRYGNTVYDLAESVKFDPKAQKHLKKILLGWVDELKI